MSDALQEARGLLQRRKYQKAVTLLRSENHFRHVVSMSEAEAMIELTAEIRVAAEKPADRHSCDLCIAELKVTLARLRADPATDAVATIADCRVLGGHGLPLQIGEYWELIFTEVDLLLRAPRHELVRVPFAQISALEIGGAGAENVGGGFIGGGFGLEGAAAGMLVATALNLVTSRTKITTVVCLQTVWAELFFLTEQETPEQLRWRLSPVFTALRQHGALSATTPPSSISEGLEVVDRLAKLASLLDRGLVTEEEFGTLKARLLASGDGEA